MPGPSDIRVNPFNNATNYVNLTERHIVPSVSPFVVRLNEVPEKQDPSNMQMFYVDDTTGQTTETALTEVAATPGAGEFRPDYSTNAFDDTSWNTGLIEFSSADAGKIIEVSYTATGTLAGVKTNRYPAWWTDRGDGSDGAFNPTGNTTISGEKNYTSVFIPTGVTVTVNKYARLKVQGAVVIHGVLTADGQGNAGNENGMNGAHGGAPGGEGAGGSGNYIYNVAASGESAKYYALHCSQGFALGAGGGNTFSGVAGGAGGGAIAITCKSIFNDGTITAKGDKGTDNARYGGGGGAGGTVIIISNRIISIGTITVDGGSGGSGSYAGTSGENGYIETIELGD